MNEIRELTKQETDVLYRDFPSGRPLNFFSPAAPGGFSLVAGLSNSLEKVGGVERTPDWVRQICETARHELTEAAMLLPYASRIPTIGTGPIFEVSTGGTFIRADEKNGPGRIAVLLARQKAWLIAAWNGKTGEAQTLPELGCPIKVPIEYDKEGAKTKREDAVRQAHQEISRMQKEANDELLAFLIPGLVVFIVIGLLMWLSK